MSNARLRPQLTLALLALLVAMSVGASAMPAARAAADRQGGGLTSLTPGSPLYGPAIDPRALRDRQRQDVGASTQSTPAELPAGLLDRLRGAAGPGQKAAPAGAALAQTGGCTQWVFDPGLEDVNGDGFVNRYLPNNEDHWYTDEGTAYADTDIYTSAPNAARMQDGDAANGEAETDMISTDIDIGASDTDLSIEFQLYQTASDPGYDFLYYGLATFNGTALNEFLYWNVVPDQTPGEWNTIYDQIDDPALIQQIKDNDLVGTGVWIVFFNNTDGLAPFVGSIIDDVYATTCDASAKITGTVRDAGAAAAATPLLLTYADDAGTFETVSETSADPAGAYDFSGLRPLAGDGSDSYQVYFSNDGSDSSRVSLWAGPRATSLSGGTVSLPAFDLKDIALSSPASEVVSTLPATFSWASRGLGDRGYYFCIYDPDSFAGGCTNRLSATSYQLTLADVQGLADLGFQYGRRYAWYVVAEAAGGDAGTGVNYGFSFYERGVSFSATAPPAPPAPPPPSGQPPSGGAGKDWTVMVYIAGDNNLGDLRRYPNAAANLQGQFATLKGLAVSYPNINIVTQTDFYDGSGTQLCHLRSNGTQACQQLGEKDSSSPATLTSFINSAMDRFPASHTMLVIADHGHAIGGVAADETTSPTATMDPAEIRKAYQDSRLATKKADVIFYSACLMGSFEIAYDTAPFANYMVASSDELWVLSVYERMLPLLSGANKNNPRAVAAGIVDAYRRSVQAAGAGLFISSAAYDLSKVADVNNRVGLLGAAIADGLNSGRAELVRSTVNRVRSNAQVYDSSGNNLLDPSEDAFVDLRHLAILLRDIPNSGAGGSFAELGDIKVAAGNLLNTLGPVGGASSMVVASAQISGSNGEGGAHNLANAQGLALFLPNGSAESLGKGQQRALTNLYLNDAIFTHTAEWDAAVRLYTGVGSGSSPTGGPGRFVSGTLPIDGALPEVHVYMPLLRR